MAEWCVCTPVWSGKPFPLTPALCQAHASYPACSSLPWPTLSVLPLPALLRTIPTITALTTLLYVYSETPEGNKCVVRQSTRPSWASLPSVLDLPAWPHLTLLTFRMILFPSLSPPLYQRPDLHSTTPISLSTEALLTWYIDYRNLISFYSFTLYSYYKHISLSFSFSFFWTVRSEQEYCDPIH